MTDLSRYRNGAALLFNWQVLPMGGVRRRDGTRYVATAGIPSTAVVIKPFEPSTSNAYVVEFGHQYIRFYQNSVYTGIELTAGVPYVASTLRQLRSAQANDVMLLVHPTYAPRRLIRTGPSTFQLSLLPFYPPPTYEAGTVPSTTLTLSATTGSITMTAGANVFTASDLERTVTAGAGRAVITGYTSATVVSALVIDAFASTSIASLAWKLDGSPMAQLSLDKAEPVGATVTLTLGVEQPSNPELVAHGSFDSAFTGWTDYSGQVQLATGTHQTTANSTTSLLDNTANFVTSGVLTTHLIYNVTDGSNGVVTLVSPRELQFSGLLKGGIDGDFDVGDTYVITETGASRVRVGVAELSGGTAGHGWIEQGVSTTAGLSYRVAFTVQAQAMAFGVGSVVAGFNLKPELSYPPGDHVVIFTATTGTSYLQFRNNQNSWAGVTAVSCKLFTADGWRAGYDEHRYVRVHGGLIKLRTITDGHTASGEIIRVLTSAADAPLGAWSIEDPVWSDTLGWPSAVVLYEGRLYLAGSAAFPQTLWGSAVNSFFDFYTGSNPEDAVELHLVDSGGNITLNRIGWMMPAENMMVGTSHCEYRLIGSGDDPITAGTPPRNRTQSAFGSDVVAPIKIDQVLIFPQRQGSKLREITFDQAATTRFQTRDISLLSEHLLRTARLVELTYAPEPIATVYGVRNDGVLLGITYDVGEQITGWWQFVTNGQVESLAVIPHPTNNAYQVWLVVHRTINGSPTRYIEVVDPDVLMPYIANGVSQQWQGLKVDCAKTGTGPITTITGLNHLNNMVVSIVADGTPFPDQVVTSNQVVLPSSVNVYQVGLAYPSQGRTLPPELPGGTTIQASQRHWFEVGVLLDATPSLRLQGQDLTEPNYGLFTGERHIPQLGWDRDGTLTFEVFAPLPATLLGLVGKLDLEMEQDT